MAEVEDVVENILEHHGIKGMHWGSRKSSAATGSGGGHGGSAPLSNRQQKKVDKQEHADWKKNAQSGETANKVFQEATRTFAPKLNIINNDANYKGKDLTKNPRLARQYDATVNHYFNEHLAQTSINMTFNKKTNRAMIYQFDRNVGMMRATEHKLVTHADDPAFPDLKAEIDELGHVVGFTPVGLVEHAIERGADFLEHYGVKGMHWGSRKGSSGGSSGGRISSRVAKASAHIKKDIAERQSSETTVRTKPGSMVRVVGGVKRLPHEDAIKARVAEQIAKKNTLDALSNPELQHLVNRMNLESQYRNLASNETRASSGEKAAKSIIGSKHADVALAKLGPHAAIGKQVVNGAFKSATRNKATEGGTVKKDKEKKK